MNKPFLLHCINDGIKVFLSGRNVLKDNSVLDRFAAHQGIADRVSIQQPVFDAIIADIIGIGNVVAVQSTFLTLDIQSECVKDVIAPLMEGAFNKKGWEVQNPNLKIFVIAGENDPVIQNKKKFESLVKFLKERGYGNVSSKLYPSMRHEILNEKNNQNVYNEVLDFLCK